MNELKPVAWMHIQGDYSEPRLWRIAEDMAERGWDEQPLYAIPDTHRVVPVEVLQATMTVAYPFELKLCEKIRAIIEDKP